MQPEALREARDWLHHGQRDLDTVAAVLRGPIVLPEMAAYHAQQAAEKALKGFLAAHDHPFPKTHDLERLVGWCRVIDPEFVRFSAVASSLNPYISQFRYPGGPQEPPLDEAQEALRLAPEVVAFVQERLLGI